MKYAVVKVSNKILNKKYCEFEYVGEHYTQFQTFTVSYEDLIIYKEPVGSIGISFIENLLLDRIITTI
jgi:hypothetical protein